MILNLSQLNLDQKAAALKIQMFIESPLTDGKIFTLTGGPGTGKTFMLRTILDGYKGSVQAATVSHAAKNILQESLGDRVECITVAKLLGLSMSIGDDGAIKFVRSGSSKGARTSQIGNSKLLIIDEVSQIEDYIYDMIMHEARNTHVKVIAVGDPYQLPPVEQNHDSQFFAKINSTLTIPMRFQGPIADLATAYRLEIDNINNNHTFDKWVLNTYSKRMDCVTGNTGYIFENKLQSIIELAANDIVSHPESTSYARILAFRNESVTEINKRIRAQIYGANLNQFESNELVICNGGYSSYVSLDGGANTRRIPILYNGQVLKVRSFIPISGPEGIPCILVYFTNFAYSIDHPVIVVDRGMEGQLAYNSILSSKLLEAKSMTDVKLAREAWKRYYAFIESFAKFDYGYSVNLYKAQGQTLNNVYVCEGEVMDVKPLTWKQKFQALYVAMTRAKEKLYIYNKEF